jgi:uncharacterized protein (DUF2132 family)
MTEEKPADKQTAARSMDSSRDPLHGVTLEMMVSRLVARHGWTEMGQRIAIRCFLVDPSIKSSLAFLRKTPWARQKVEAWYAYDARRFSMVPTAEIVATVIPDRPA